MSEPHFTTPLSPEQARAYGDLFGWAGDPELAAAHFGVNPTETSSPPAPSGEPPQVKFQPPTEPPAPPTASALSPEEQEREDFYRSLFPSDERY